MSKYLKLFETTSQYESYMGGGEKILPNVSLIEETNKVEYNPYPDPADLIRVICTYNVTSTSSPTTLLDTTTGISKQIIDGVEQSSVVKNYTFDTTGEHVVKYEYANNQINSYAFSGCRNLTSITIPNSVTEIGYSAFTYCSGLTSITIPDSVTNIQYDAFGSCSNLTSVTVESITPPSLGAGVFANNASGRKIYVPSASVNTYKTASNWSTYASDIEAIPTT